MEFSAVDGQRLAPRPRRHPRHRPRVLLQDLPGPPDDGVFELPKVHGGHGGKTGRLDRYAARGKPRFDIRAKPIIL